MSGGSTSGPVRAILGPTASGKSSLALEVVARLSARDVAAEIVAVDAFTIYRGMDIATATPSADDRRRARHHLVDVIEPSEEISVVRFRELARTAIAEVHARGAIALLVGGSGLYWRAAVDGLRFPPTDSAVRARIEERAVQDADALYAELVAVDPEAARIISARNVRRVVRALEVIELTGETFSSFDDAWQRYESIYPDLEVAYLEPPTDELRRRIDARAATMVDAGLLDEARALAAMPRSRTAASAIGYAEADAVNAGTLPREQLATRIADRTWRYARRQRSWFRADPRCAPVRTPDEVLDAWG
jgi:tRNA dimethylallyltransferase